MGLGSLRWPGLLLAPERPLERSHHSPLRVRREETVKYESRGQPCCSARACHIHLRWQMRRLTAQTGACFSPSHAHPNPRLKEPPPFSLSLSLHQSVVSLSVSHLSNPVTLLQAPTPSHLRLYIFLAPSRPLSLCITVPSTGLLNSEAAEVRGCGRLRPEW